MDLVDLRYLISGLRGARKRRAEGLPSMLLTNTAAADPEKPFDMDAVFATMDALKAIPKPEPGIPIGDLWSVKVYVDPACGDVIFLMPEDPFLRDGDQLRRVPLSHRVIAGTPVQKAAQDVMDALASAGEQAKASHPAPCTNEEG